MTDAPQPLPLYGLVPAAMATCQLRASLHFALTDAMEVTVTLACAAGRLPSPDVLAALRALMQAAATDAAAEDAPVLADTLYALAAARSEAFAVSLVLELLQPDGSRISYCLNSTPGS